MFIKNQEIEIISEVLGVNGCMNSLPVPPNRQWSCCTSEYPPGPIIDQFGQYLMPKCEKITCV